MKLKYKLKNFIKTFPVLYKVIEKVYYSMKTFQSRLFVSFLSSDIKYTGHKPNLGHLGLGVVVGKAVYIGKNVYIGQNVTIGGKKNKFPIIEDNVCIYCNSIVLGGIRIGKNSIIGAGTFVDKDIPPNSLCIIRKSLS